MSPQQNKPKGYMQQLDYWIGETVIWPLAQAFQDREKSGRDEPLDQTVVAVKKAMREKVLESYHNGQAAQSTGARKRTSYAKR